MKKFISPLAFLFLMTTAFADSPSEKTISQAEAFIKNTGNEIIGLIRSSKDMPSKKRHFKNLLNNHFDLKAIGQFVLGRYWRAASDKEKKEFLKLFEQNIVDTYTSQFDQYKDETLKVLKANKSRDGAIWVESQIRGSERNPLQVRWKLYERRGKFKIYDIYVNEASMSITQRSEYATIIQRNGGRVQALLNELRKSNSQRSKET